MITDKPSVDEVIRKFKEFVGDSILIGHNIKGCDIPHITRAAKPIPTGETGRLRLHCSKKQPAPTYRDNGNRTA